MHQALAVLGIRWMTVEEKRLVELTNGIFGGNSNWWKLIWFPVNYLLTELLQRFHQFFGKDLTAEYFYSDNGARLGTNQQTGWTGLMATLIHYMQ